MCRSICRIKYETLSKCVCDNIYGIKYVPQYLQNEIRNIIKMCVRQYVWNKICAAVSVKYNVKQYETSKCVCKTKTIYIYFF